MTAKTLALSLAALLFLGGAAGSGGKAELFGRPLRGLSPVPLGDVAAAPERHAAKAIRVEGTLHATPQGLNVSDGTSSVGLETDGTFTLPSGIDGARVAAEGRARRAKSGAIFTATGVEVTR